MKKLDTLEQQIEKQQERLKQLIAKKQAVESRQKAKEKKQARADDTRKKILLGSFLQKKMQDEQYKQNILDELNQYLTENRDRLLFGLAEIQNPSSGDHNAV